MNFGKETETIEFKKSTSELKEGMISISSILNKHGVGTLYFGIKPNGDVIGQEVSESSLRDVSRLIYESIKPQIYPIINEETIEDKHIIKVEFNGEEKPYSAFGRYYLRTADEDRKITPIELKHFFTANEYKEKWEKTVTNCSIDDADKKCVKEFYTNAIAARRLAKGKYSVSNILNRFGLVKDGYLTNAGNVLFGKKYPVTLKAAVFATDEKLTFLDMQMYEDNIFNLLKLAEAYIAKNINWRVEINGLGREEIPEIPMAVIREALANSFAHSIYNGNTYHEICIYPNKVTIYSPGPYASSFKPEDYVKRSIESSIRNETISKILYMNKSIEQFGSGFKRIDSLCKDAKIIYSYEATDIGFTFIIYRKANNVIYTNNTLKVNDQFKLTKTEQLILSLLEINPSYTRDELAEAISKTVRTVQRGLDSLRDKGLITREGSDKSGYWVIDINNKINEKW